jgi:hypothetical protein
MDSGTNFSGRERVLQLLCIIARELIGIRTTLDAIAAAQQEPKFSPHSRNGASPRRQLKQPHSFAAIAKK